MPPITTPAGTIGSARAHAYPSLRRARRRPLGQVDPSSVSLVAGIGACLAAAEVVTLAGGTAPGVLAHATVLLALVAVSLRQPAGPAQQLTLTMALVPLIRMLSLTLPAAIIPIVYWYLEIGLAAFEGIFLTMRRLDLTPRDVGLRSAPTREIVSVGLAGLVLGIPAYLIVGPVDLGQGGGLVGLGVASVVVIVFVGFLEELLFRGLIQTAGTQLFSRGGVIVSVGATVLMYSASLNPRYVIFAALVAAFFGLVARRSGSIAAPVAGHAALAWMQLVVLPIILS